jgi:hypothetical protein
MFRFLQNSLFNLVGQPRGKRSASPARQRRLQLRVESLESRSMLASVLISFDSDYGFTLQAGGSSVTNGFNYQRELELPQTELAPNWGDGGQIPIPNEPWIPESKPITPTAPPVTPPANSTPPASSTPVPDVVPEEPGDTGGLVDLGSETEPTDPSDGSPFDDPSPRESRSVMQMLAALQYPISGGDNVADLDSQFDDAEQHVRRLETVLTEADGGAVAIAIQDIADEFAAAGPAPNIDEASLLEISVQMDRSAGRYQAFEVLTSEEVPLPAAEVGPTYTPQPPANPAAVNFESTGETNAVEMPRPTSNRHPTDSATGAEAVAAGTAAVAAADEKSSSTWSLAVALVTCGFVLQLLRDRHGNRLQAKAASVWHSLLAVTFWKPSRREQTPVGPRPQ